VGGVVPADLHVLHGAVEDLLEGDFYLDQLRLPLPWPGLLPAPAREQVEQPSEAGAARRSAVLDALLAVVVVELALLGVGEDFVGGSDLFELLGVSALVGVLLQCLLAEGLADLLSGRLLVHGQQLVVLLCVHLFLLLLRTLLLVHAAEAPEPTAEHRL
jgi:hypothetical protein